MPLNELQIVVRLEQQLENLEGSSRWPPAMDAGAPNSRPLLWRNHHGNRADNQLNNRRRFVAPNSRPLIWRNQYGKRPETQLDNRQYGFANKRRKKQAVNCQTPMEIDEWICKKAADRHNIPMERDEWMNIPRASNATMKHSSSGPSNFGGSPLNWQRNSAVRFGGRPDGNHIFPSCHRVLNSRQKFRHSARNKRCRNEEYSREHHGEIEMEKLDNGNREADLPLIVCPLPEINRRFTWMRRWDERTQSEASSPCSAKLHGLDSDQGDHYERMDIDNDGEYADFRALLGDIQEKLGDLDVYTADDVSEHCTQPFERLCL